jgi:hypothetical protein|tara:strand:+ start:2470 stop:2637 length:168 start_codon:yes stop_codon:yes gene_type:complete
MRKPAKILLAIAAIIILGTVGDMDYRDAVLAEQNYDGMVCEGLWPDYKNISPVCD